MTPSMGLLIADQLRRMNRWVVLFFAAFVGGMWWMDFYFEQPSRAFATSMWMAIQMGPQQTLWLVPRPLWYLPASRRAVWRSGWLVSVAGVPAMTTAVKLVAALVSWGSARGIASVGLSALFDIAAAGVGCTLAMLAIHPRPAGALRRPATIAQGCAQFLFPLSGFLFFAGWQTVALPTRWSDLTPLSTSVLAAALALALATYFYEPRPLAAANRVVPPPAPAAPATRVRESRLTGIPRLLVREAGWAFSIGGSLAAAAVVFVTVMARVSSDEHGLSDLLRKALMARDAGESSVQDFGVGAFNLLLWYGVFAAAMATRLPLIMRHLRALPIGTVRINALLVGWPAAIWLLAWAGTSGLHYVVLGQLPAQPHLASTVAIIGVCTLAQAVILRMATVSRFVLFMVVAGLVPHVSLLTPLSPPALLAVGVASVAAAIVINHVALSRSSTYRLTIVPIGAPLSR
jgi:hypothetical protein